MSKLISVVQAELRLTADLSQVFICFDELHLVTVLCNAVMLSELQTFLFDIPAPPVFG